MSAIVVYLDNEHAKLFKLEPGHADETKMNREEVRHHTNNEEKKHKDSNKFYHDVASRLTTASEILVVGHGTAKEQFIHHLKDHHHEAIAKKVVGVETVDNPTDKQILALARKSFKKIHLFT